MQPIWPLACASLLLFSQPAASATPAPATAEGPRCEDLQHQVTELQQLIQLKDDQLAAMQKQIEETLPPEAMSVSATPGSFASSANPLQPEVERLKGLVTKMQGLIDKQSALINSLQAQQR